MDCIAAHITKVEYKVDGVETKVATHSAAIMQMRRDIENLKHGPAAGQAQPSSAAASSAEGWVPPTIHFRAWAPHGAPSSQKLAKIERLELQKESDKKTPQEWRTRTRWLAPFILSHSLSMEVLNASPMDSKRLADIVNMALAEHPVEVRGSRVRVAVESSPARRRLLQIWHLQRDLIIGLNGDNVTKCERALEIYNKIGMVRIGHIGRSSATWVWNEFAAATAAIKLPIHMEEEEEEEKKKRSYEEGSATPRLAQEQQEDHGEQAPQQELDMEASENVDPNRRPPAMEGHSMQKKPRLLGRSTTS